MHEERPYKTKSLSRYTQKAIECNDQVCVRYNFLDFLRMSQIHQILNQIKY